VTYRGEVGVDLFLVIAVCLGSPSSPGARQQLIERGTASLAFRYALRLGRDIVFNFFIFHMAFNERATRPGLRLVFLGPVAGLSGAAAGIALRARASGRRLRGSGVIGQPFIAALGRGPADRTPPRGSVAVLGPLFVASRRTPK
jgi:hypothetical protein